MLYFRMLGYSCDRCGVRGRVMLEDREGCLTCTHCGWEPISAVVGSLECVDGVVALCDE